MKRIIHVDNSEFFRKLVKTFLAERGYLAESFSHGSEAFEAINSGDVGLIITGMSFSDMDGEDFVKKIIGTPYAVPIIALTSSHSPEQQKTLQDLGIKAFILKSGSWQENLLFYLDKYFPLI